MTNKEALERIKRLDMRYVDPEDYEALFIVIQLAMKGMDEDELEEVVIEPYYRFK